MSNHEYIEFPAGIDKRCLYGVCYELDHKTDTLTISREGDFCSCSNKRAVYLVNWFGLKKIIILKNLAVSFSVLLLLLLLLAIPLEDSWHLSTIFFLASIMSFFVVLDLRETENYYTISKCKKCGRDFACEEIKKPLIKKISTYDSYEETETRYVKCKYCKKEDIKIISLLKSSKSKKRKTPTKGKTCKSCGRRFSLIEYRHPDTHFEEPSFVRTIRHYKCANCGYMEISIKYEDISNN